MSEKTYRWIAIQPLIGGCMLGAEKAFKSKPECVLDYQGIANSELYMTYQKEVQKADIPHFIFNGSFISKAMEFETEEMTEAFNKLNHDIDCVVAVPVCSGLSGANSTGSGDKKAGSDAVQNNNQLGILDFVTQKIKPKVYIYENAPALFTNLGKGLREKINTVAEETGYHVQYNKVNTLNYGLPQHRQRTFCILWRKDIYPSVPKFPFECLDRQTLVEFFKSCPPEDNEAELVKAFNERPMINYLKAHFGNRDTWLDEYFADQEHNTFDYLIDGNEYDLCIKAAKPFRDKIEKDMEHIQKKLAENKGFFTDDNYGKNPDHCGAIYWKQFRQTINPIRKRFLGKREAMKLMGMPDDFACPAAEAMIGQNVPVNTAYMMCKNIVLGMENELPLTGETVSMQNLTKDDKPVVVINTKVNKFIK